MIETYQTSNVLRDIYLLYSLNLNLVGDCRQRRFGVGGPRFSCPAPMKWCIGRYHPTTLALSLYEGEGGGLEG